MKTEAKFKIGDKVKISRKYSDPGMEHKYGRILTKYGEVKNIVFDGKRNIYYVKFKHNIMLYPCYAENLDLYDGDEVKTLKDAATNNDPWATHLKERPKFVVGQYVTLTENVFDDLTLKGVLYDKFKVTTDDLKGGFDNDSSYQKLKNKIVDKNTRYKIVNVAFDKTHPVYGLEGFGSLYFYEDEIVLAELQDPDEIQEQKNISITTCLNALQSMVENGKKLGVELI